MVEDVELNRLYWHSRRGMLELDVLLVPFVKEVYATLNDVDRECYRKLLECEDQDMFGWFMERRTRVAPCATAARQPGVAADRGVALPGAG